MKVKALTDDELTAAVADLAVVCADYTATLVDAVTTDLASFAAATCNWIKSLPPEVIDEYNLHIAE